MPVFVVIATKGHQTIDALIKERFKDDAYTLKADAWFVEFDGTTAQLADELGIRDGRSGAGIIIPVTNYNGRAPADVWEWLTLHSSKSG